MTSIANSTATTTVNAFSQPIRRLHFTSCGSLSSASHHEPARHIAFCTHLHHYSDDSSRWRCSTLQLQLCFVNSRSSLHILWISTHSPSAAFSSAAAISLLCSELLYSLEMLVVVCFSSSWLTAHFDEHTHTQAIIRSGHLYSS